ncbi:hypothetical protein GXW74_19930 [Roseomonas eburnea]|uniref:Uncharacterized protein n=1 Tax=Neoroseomonas eburnea TaxID=1346889 RepID=A0A9X9XGD6_9PROT|nr:hypothetical protein [Neoroseomonas eburnea]MBR0682772.1 hypothetical protein [Neoroseomonas eburnea]
MTLDLSPNQPTEDAAAPGSDAGPALAVIATLVTTNGVVVQVGERPDGALVLSPNGNRLPLVFDRHQAGALRSVLAEG